MPDLSIKVGFVRPWIAENEKAKTRKNQGFMRVFCMAGALGLARLRSERWRDLTVPRTVIQHAPFESLFLLYKKTKGRKNPSFYTVGYFNSLLNLKRVPTLIFCCRFRYRPRQNSYPYSLLNRLLKILPSNPSILGY